MSGNDYKVTVDNKIMYRKKVNDKQDIVAGNIMAQADNKFFIKYSDENNGCCIDTVERENIVAIYDDTQYMGNYDALFLGDVKVWSGFFIKLQLHDHLKFIKEEGK